MLSDCLCHGRPPLCRASLRALWDLASAQREGPFPRRTGPEMGVQDGDSSHRSIASTTGQTDAARGTWSAGAVAVSLLSSLSHWLGSAVAVRTEMQGQKKDSAS